jgi:hypothetical protein
MKTSKILCVAALCFFSMSLFGASREKTSGDLIMDQADYDELTMLLFNEQNDPEFICSPKNERVIIINFKGYSIREDCIDGDNIFSSTTLSPLIQRSNIVMKIGNTSYYLLEQE